MLFLTRFTRRHAWLGLTLIVMVAALACNISVGGAAAPTPAPVEAVAATADTSGQESAPQEPAPQEPTQESAPGGETTDNAGQSDQPTPLPAPPAAPAQNAEFSGISFFRDNKVAGGWAAEIVLAQEADEDSGPIEWLLPSHYLFSLTDYAVTSNNVQTPRLYVFPVDNYEDYNNAGPQRIAALTTLLKDKPQTFPDEIPVLPVFNAAQVFRAQTRYIAFQNGEGIRFVTAYAQSFNPITNDELLYMFEGLTYDGQYYVSLILPLNAIGFDLTAEDVIGGDYDAFAANIQNYMQTTVQTLNDADGSTFTPTLEQLDTLVNSLTVAPN